MILIALAFLLAAALFWGLSIGTVKLPLDQIYNSVLEQLMGDLPIEAVGRGPVHDIVWLLRLPRLVLAALIGCGLAVCGVIMQAIVKNPLADPYILGISSGASLGATSAILLGIGASLGPNFVGISAFIGTSINTGGAAWKRMEKMYPEEIKKVKIINRYHPDAETVVAANPDLIIGWKSTFTSVLKKSTAWWNERGIRTYVVSTSNHLHAKGSIEDECCYLDDMGQIFDVCEKTDKMIKEIHDELSRTQELIKGRASQAVMVVEPAGKVFYNYDNGWVVGDMVEQLGGYMPAGERRIGCEELISYNPDVLFVVYFNEEQHLQIIEMFRHAEFSSLKSVKNQRVYPIPFDHMYTPAIKTIDGLRMIRDGLYPDLAKKEGEKE